MIKKTVCISHDNGIAGGINDNNFNFYINCPFQPDFVILRNISYFSYSALSSLCIGIQSELINNNILTFFSDFNNTFIYNQKFPIIQPINKAYNFSFIHADGTNTTIFKYQIVLYFEFIKYNNIIMKDISKLPLRKIVIINHDTFINIGSVGDNQFNFYINCLFQPDQVIVRNISYFNYGVAPIISNKVFTISSDLVDNFNLASFNDFNSTFIYNIKFLINQPICKYFNFSLLNASGTSIVPTQYQLIIALEFIKYSG